MAICCTAFCCEKLASSQSSLIPTVGFLRKIWDGRLAGSPELGHSVVLSQRYHCQLQHSPRALPMRAWHGGVSVTHPAAGGRPSHPAAGSGPPEGPSNSVGDRVVARSHFPALEHMSVSPAICFQPTVKRTIINK